MSQSIKTYTAKNNPYFKNGEPLNKSKVISGQASSIIKEFDKSEKVISKNLFIESYGCQMNFSDSEIVASILSKNGYQITVDKESADLILVNTCSIREKAEQTVRKRLKLFTGDLLIDFIDN